MKSWSLKIQSVIVVLSLQNFSLRAQASVWENRESWSSQKEADFQDWVRHHWHKNFFATKTDRQGQPNPYYGILNDCADTVYTMRLIFAYENRLPFVINDPTGGRLLISNSMSRWDHEPNETIRVRKFINYIHNIVSTLSLPNDTYPVAISRETLVPGSLLMTGQKNHHSWTMKEMLSIGVPHLIFNSVVRSKSSPVLQERKTWPNPSWIFEGMGSDFTRAGFRYWKPVEYLKIPGIQVPEASLEQYNIPLRRWVSTIQNKLATERESAEGGLVRVIEALCDGFNNRVSNVKEAIDFKRTSARMCMTPADFDNFSTPSRDHRIFDDYITLRDLYLEATSKGETLSSSMQRKMMKMFPFPELSPLAEARRMTALKVDDDSLCPFTYSSGKTIDLAEAKRRMFIGEMSSNPDYSMGKRWGESRPLPDPGDSCPAPELWKPFH